MVFCNLFFRMHEKGIKCPEVLLLRKHILVMSFIGFNQKPAPKLKDARLSNAEYIIAYEQCIEVCSLQSCCFILLHFASFRLSFDILSTQAFLIDAMIAKVFTGSSIIKALTYVSKTPWFDQKWRYLTFHLNDRYLALIL